MLNAWETHGGLKRRGIWGATDPSHGYRGKPNIASKSCARLETESLEDTANKLTYVQANHHSVAGSYRLSLGGPVQEHHAGSCLDTVKKLKVSSRRRALC
jgi:hypothetical protein